MSGQPRETLLRELCNRLPAESAADVRRLDPQDPLTLVKAYSAIKQHAIVLPENLHQELTATVDRLIRADHENQPHDLVDAPVLVDSSVLVREEADVLVIDLIGDLDLNVIELLRGTFIESITEQTNRVVVNLSRTTFMDSIVLGSLVAAQRRAIEAGGWLRLAAPRRNVEQVIHLTGLDQVLEIRESVAAAVGLDSPTT